MSFRQQDDGIRIGAASSVGGNGQHGDVGAWLGVAVSPVLRIVRQIPDLDERHPVAVPGRQRPHESLEAARSAGGESKADAPSGDRIQAGERWRTAMTLMPRSVRELTMASYWSQT